MLMGCIHPAEVNKDQVFSFQVSPLPSSTVPEFHWEIMWKVQIIERGVMKGYFYGGFDTELVLNYNANLEEFSLDAINSADLWDLSDCTIPSPISLVSGLIIDGYSITDTDKQVIYSAEDPFCSVTRAPTFSPSVSPSFPTVAPPTTPSSAPTASSSVSSTTLPTVMCTNGLYDGDFIFRATASENWSFCGVQGLWLP
jgi:hypothetical protein